MAWKKRENLYLSPILPLEAFALPELEEWATQKPHADMKTKHSKHVLNIQSFPQAATLSHIAVIRNWDAIPFPPLEWHHSYPQGIYRCCSLDEFFEVCEVSSGQERALSKRFPKNMFCKPSLLPLTRLQWSALQIYNNNHHGRTSLSNFFICSCVLLPSRHAGFYPTFLFLVLTWHHATLWQCFANIVTTFLFKEYKISPFRVNSV